MHWPYAMGATKVADSSQPRFDSNGIKVPIWEAIEVEIRKDEKNPLKTQNSWGSWISKTTSWGSTTGRKPLWKPATLRFPVLGSIFTVTVLMVIVLEILAYISVGKNNSNGGGLVFAATVDDISTIATVSYLYLPTVIAVLYSIVWSWVDLDSKRLEPWFQLSKPEGATAEDSLLLQYPFDFLPFVPIRAARRRHWAVFITGTTLMLVTWAIVPFQSAIFSKGTVTRTREVLMATTGSLIPLEEQKAALNSQFLNTAYGVSWLGQKVPPYTTKEYALQPFAPVTDDATHSGNDTWSSSTLAYYTNLTCTPALMRPGKVNTSWIFDNGNGCATYDIALSGASSAEFLVMYIPYFDDPHSDWALQNENCTSDQSDNFLAIWAEPQHIENSDFMKFGNISAQFCRPTYHVRHVTATVNATTQAVLNIDYSVALDTDTPLLETDFNITNFEYIMGTGIAEDQISHPFSGDLQDISVIEQLPRLAKFNLTWPNSNMVGYGMAASSGRAKDLADPSQMHKAFESAHKLLFSVAVAAMTTTNEEPTDERVGLLVDQPGSIVFVRSFSIAVEAFLAVVGILTCVLWVVYQQRQTNMTQDPASIADVMKLVCSAMEPLQGFHDSGTLTTGQLGERLRGNMYRLNAYSKGGASEMRLESLSQNDEKDVANTAKFQTSIDCPEQFQAVRPLELTMATGSIVGAVIIAAITILIYLYHRVMTFNGLARPSTNPLVLSILENLVPTAFATINEPFWILLNRLLCILQPFSDLRQGKAKPDATVEAKYTSIPPQLAVWRALRSGHFLLAIVCTMAISMNVLAVALSGLFDESLRDTKVSMGSNATYAPLFNGIPELGKQTAPIEYKDHFYATLANLRGNAPLPPWADKSFYYLPFDVPNSKQAIDKELRIDGYSALTRGFGVDVNCEQIFEEGGNDTLVYRPKNNGSIVEFGMVHKLADGGNVTCISTISSPPGELPLGPPGDGASASEFVTPLELYNETGNSLPDNGYCSSVIVSGWVRLGAAAPLATTSTEGIDGRSLQTAFMRCLPMLRTAVFNVTVDTTNRIIKSTRQGEFETDLEPYGTEATITSLISQTSTLLIPRAAGIVRWHNDTFAMDWINTLLKIKFNSDLLNSTKPVPDIPTTIPHFADIYRRLAAVMFSFDGELFEKAPAKSPITVLVHAKETRIFMTPTMFYISITILFLQLFTLVAYYTMRPRRFLPRMPLSIASIIAYVSASQAAQDYGKRSREKSPETRYGYGRFKGADGRTHVGIEKEPLVVPLKSKNPEATRRKWRFGRSLPPEEPRIWI
ncbi:hypothetical protein V495_08699 [Pseudogymnoascus sp. VKM F-4514 (FW-929)]|nr:hypothetical protein V495_08699 [Pseudogymnoascus sp. VKM F-4514 (FW-929)]KFY55466.1 hypothetical protein V497_06929 [Pseudogymnoascus sp. VKM F-4516 (FW-969)]